MCAAELFACVVFWLVALAVIVWMLSAPLRAPRRRRMRRKGTESHPGPEAPPRRSCEDLDDDIKLGLTDDDD